MSPDSESPREVGDRGLLLAAVRPGQVAAALRDAARVRGLSLSDVVPGAASVLAVVARAVDMAALRGIVTDVVAAVLAAGEADSDAGLASTPPAPGPGGASQAGSAQPEVVEITVVYDGPDLGVVAETTGLSVDEVVSEHQRGSYVADFTGFAPGFAYLSGLPRVLWLPRLSAPRPLVPLGSVAIADRYSAVYPRESPGGWHLLGHTTAAVWDSERDPPALLTPGTLVRFVAAPPAGTKSVVDRPRSTPELDRRPVLSNRGYEDQPAGGFGWLEVLDGGLLTTVQDAGRPGLADQGVSPSGWLDARSASLANRLIGNDPGAAVLETTIKGPSLRLGGLQGSSRRLAVTGAPTSVRIDGQPVAMQVPLEVPVGARIEIGTVTAGARTYLAASGGLDVTPVLCSRSTDMLSGLGPPPLRDGQRLALGADHGGQPPVDVAPVAPLESPPTLRVRPGPRADHLTSDAFDVLVATTWTVGADSNRVGLRLSGATIGRSTDVELPPEGVVTGSVQVPSSGEPVLFLADHPVTGGYPVLAVVVDADIHLAGQVAPGAALRFAAVRPGLSGLPGWR